MERCRTKTDLGPLARSVNRIALSGFLCLSCSAGALTVGSDDASVPGDQTPPSADAATSLPAADAAPRDATVPPDASPGNDYDAQTLEDDAGFGDANDGALPTTLYDRLGGHTGVTRFVTDLFVAQLRDPQQASYFVFNVPSPVPGHPSASDMIECLTNLMGSAIGGYEIYPSPTSSGFQCRSIRQSHKGLYDDGGTVAGAVNYRIPNGVFDDFLAIMASVATVDGVSPADVSKLSLLFGTTRGDIVDGTRADGGYFDGG
jgi:hypothetical protein